MASSVPNRICSSGSFASASSSFDLLEPLLKIAATRHGGEDRIDQRVALQFEDVLG